MKPLYLAPPVRAGLGACLRPGGLALTERILDLAAPDRAGIVVDAGCGSGASMTLLRQYGVRTIIGLDLEADLLREARQQHRHLARADLAKLPLPDSCLAMILCECVWNLTERRQVLGEFARALRPDGILALTDVYARQGKNHDPPATWPMRCCFSQATDLDTVAELVAAAGFEVLTLEDHTRLLNRTAAEFVFTHGSLRGFWQAVTGDSDQAKAACDATAAIRPGLFLLIARRAS